MAGSTYTGGSLTGWGNYSAAGDLAKDHNVAWGTSTNDYWQITGIQMELGKVATPFEHRSYGEELALCQRYLYYVDVGGVNYKYMPCAGTNYTAGNAYTMWKYPQTMRATPELDYSDAADFQVVSGGAVRETTSVGLSGSTWVDSAVVIFGAGGAAIGHGCLLRTDANTDVFISFDSEL